MFNSFKKWIQTTVDTTNTVLNQTQSSPPQSFYNHDNDKLNRNYSLNNDLRQANRYNNHSSNLSLSSIDSTKTIRNNYENDNNDLNKPLRYSNSQTHLKIQPYNASTSKNRSTSPSPLVIPPTQNGNIQHPLSKTQPPTPTLSPLNVPTSFSVPQSPSYVPFNETNNSQIDLSHLSKEEQAHIAAVLERAKIEESQLEAQESKRKQTINNGGFKGKSSRSINSSITSITNDLDENRNSSVTTMKPITNSIKKHVSLEQVDSMYSNEKSSSFNNNNNNKRNLSTRSNSLNQKINNLNNTNDNIFNCELCNQQQQQTNASNKMYICENCNKKLCVNCKIVNQVSNENPKILCKNCFDNNIKDKLNNNCYKRQQESVNTTSALVAAAAATTTTVSTAPSASSLLATKQEIVNALINKANQNSVSPVSTITTITTSTSTSSNTTNTSTTAISSQNHKTNKPIKVSNCDEYYPNTDNIPFIHHYHHHHYHRRKMDSNSDENKNLINNNHNSKISDNDHDRKQEFDREENVTLNNSDLSLELSNSDFNHTDDETSFITYAEKEIANLERTIMLKNNEQNNNQLKQQVTVVENKQQNGAQLVDNNNKNKIHIKELQDTHLVSSIENDSDNDFNDDHEVIVYNSNQVDNEADRTSMNRIVPSSKFSDEFNKLSEQRNKTKEPEIKSNTNTELSKSKKSKRKLPVAPIEPTEDVSTQNISETTKDPSKTTTSEPSGIYQQIDVSQNPKLENVTEWLNRSFDRNETILTSNDKKIQEITLVEANKKLSETKQRQSSEESEKYLGTNDDIVEINLSNKLNENKLDNRAITQQFEQQVIILSQPSYNNQFKQKNDSNNKKPVTNINPTITIVDSRDKNLFDYNTYPKTSQNNQNYVNNVVEQSPKKTYNNDAIQRIYLYKDPKDQPDSLGMKITARQKLADVKGDLAALVTNIIPDGLVQRFDLPIKIGDEILEINGVNLRNKTDEQIRQILNNSCESNNGEIELVIRKIENKNLRSSLKSNRNPYTDLLNKTFEQIDELQSVGSSAGTLDPNRSSPSARSSMTSSPVSSEMTTHHSTTAASVKLNTVAFSNDVQRVPSQKRHESTSAHVSNKYEYNEESFDENKLSRQTHNNSNNHGNNDESFKKREHHHHHPHNHQHHHHHHREHHHENNQNILTKNNIEPSFVDIDDKKPKKSGSYNKPLLKISAPPESDTQDFEENFFLNNSTDPNGTLQRKKYCRSQSPARKTSDNNENYADEIDPLNTNKFLTTNKTVSQRNGSTKSTRSNHSNKEIHRDSLSSNASVEDVRKVSPASSQRTAVNENSSNSSINIKSNEIRFDLVDKTNLNTNNNIAINNKLNKSSNKLSVNSETLDVKNMLSSASMSSIASARKYSNESCAADVESDNFSKYFPSSHENSRRNSREDSFKRNKFNKNTKNTTDSQNESSATTTPLGININDNNSSKSSINETVNSHFGSSGSIKKTSNEKTIDTGIKKGKSKISFKFGKRSTSANSKSGEDLEARKNERRDSIANPTAPFGEIQLQIGHSEKDEQINVKIIKARNLLPKDANGFSDPFVKVYLLPGRDQDNKRRTKPITKNLNPEWNYTVVYPNVHKEELKYKTLEFTVWDYDRFKSNDFLGKVSIDLSDQKYLDDKPRWYALKGLNDDTSDNINTKSIDSSNSNKSRKSQHSNHIK